MAAGDDVLADLVTEYECLDAIFSALSDDQWMSPSGAPGWSMGDVVAHLALTEEAVIDTLGRPDGGWNERERSIDEAVAEEVRAEGLSGRAALARWQAARHASVAALAQADPAVTVRWAAAPLKPRTLATTRLAEHWAHGLDVTEPLGIDYPDTDRLRHIAWLGHATLPYAMQVAGLRPQPVFCALTAPSGASWTFGPRDAASSITGDAGAFCRVGARRLAAERSGLVAEGPHAADALRVLRNYGLTRAGADPTTFPAVNALPDNAAGYVCLSFDFDGPSLWMQRRMVTPTPVSRGEFGAVAVPRILKLLARRAIPATFFIPGHTIETYPDVCRQVVDAGCEVGLHGYAHEFNPKLSADKEKWVFGRSLALVESLTGTSPTGYRAPSGDLTAQTVSNLVEFGLRYDSSLMGHDYKPYPLRIGDEFPEDGPARWGPETPVIELPFSWTLDDYVYLEFVTFRRMLMPGLRRPEEMFANFSGDVRWMVREVRHGVCTVVFHPQVIGRGHRLLALEDWLEEISDLEIAFAQMGDVARAVAEGRTLGVED